MLLQSKDRDSNSKRSICPAEIPKVSEKKDLKL
jgi:hypothetical protein